MDEQLEVKSFMKVACECKGCDLAWVDFLLTREYSGNGEEEVNDEHDTGKDPPDEDANLAVYEDGFY